ncbi:MAG: hypothetical protein U0411_03095 [Thermodesulfovibrionales bacterium]
MAGQWSALPEEGKKDKEEKDKEKGKEHSSLLKGRKSVLVASLGSFGVAGRNACRGSDVLLPYRSSGDADPDDG